MSPHTLESYGRDFVQLLQFAAAKEVGLDGLTRQDLEEFVRSLMTSGLSPRSVETYRLRLMQKLGIADLPSLVKLAIRHGMISIE